MKKIFYFYFLIILFNSCTEDSITPEKELNNITNPPGYLINKLFIDAQGDIFAGTSAGIFKSTDEGTTWISITQPNLTIEDIIDILITPDDYIFIIGYENNFYNLYRSFDHGNSWVNLGAGYALKQDGFGNIYLCGSGLKKSSNKGNTWEELYDGGVYSVCLPGDSLIIIGVPGTFHGQIVYSTNNGMTWDSTGYIINLIDFYMYDFVLFAGGGSGDEGGGGVHKSYDKGISWETAGLKFSSITSFIRNSREQLFIGTSDGIFLTEDEGLTWENVLPDSWVTSLVRNDKNFLYAGTSDGTLLRSTDNGKSWHN